MRVAIDGRSLRGPALRGWDRYTLELVARLPRYGVIPTLVFRAGEPLFADHVRAADAAVLPISASRVSLWEQIALPRSLGRERFDLYHAPTEHGVPFFAPCPRVLTLHSVTYHSYEHLVQTGRLPGKVSDYFAHASPLSPGALYISAQFRLADHVLVPSEFARRETIELLKLPEGRVTATPLGLPRGFDAPALDAEHLSLTLSRLQIRRPYVLYVGGYERHKNAAGFLAAAQHVLAQEPDVQFVLVGTGSVPKELTDLARPLGGSVRFLSNVTDDLVAIYEGASVFASLSYRETFCLPALESLSRGVPVVASQWGATGDVVGDHGSLIDPRSPNAAAVAILRWLRSPVNDKSPLRKRALSFTWDDCVERTVDVYRRLARRRR
jgi:glycosyltransferase involved in cell wall biosynthesis